MRPFAALCLFAALAAVLAGSVAPARAGLSTTASTGAESAAPQKGGDEKSGAKDGAAKDTPDDSADTRGLFASQDNLVPLPVIIAPVVLPSGKLCEHLYFFVAAVTVDVDGAAEVKKHMPYIQDALVRDVFKTPATVADPSQDPDTASVVARFKAVINGVVGQPVVATIKVGRIDTSPY